MGGIGSDAPFHPHQKEHPKGKEIKCCVLHQDAVTTIASLGERKETKDDIVVSYPVYKDQPSFSFGIVPNQLAGRMVGWFYADVCLEQFPDIKTRWRFGVKLNFKIKVGKSLGEASFIKNRQKEDFDG